jgi:D-glycero-D-manno-heptose 1,7-bisphosphate phosphatase
MKLVILDRDGVINEDSDDFIKTLDEFIPLPGSLEAISRLKQAGYTIAVATNQSGLSRGYLDIDTLNAMHDKLNVLLAEAGGSVDGIFYCPHGPDEGCECRKPKPGLYNQISQQFDTPLEGIPVIGDSLRDLEAARAVGAKPTLVRTGKGLRTLEAGKGLENVPVYENLAEAVDALLKDALLKEES